MKPERLKTRVLLWFGLVLSVVLLLFGIGVGYLFERNVTGTIHDRLTRTALEIENQIASGTPVETLLAHAAAQHHTVAIFRGDRLIGATQDFPPALLSDPTHIAPFRLVDKGETLHAILRHPFSTPFVGSTVLEQEGINDKGEDLVDTMLFLLPLLVLVLIYLGSRLIDRILTPIHAITHAAERINIQHLTTTIPLPEKDDELHALVEAFNAMIHRLDAGREQIERFNSDVSHELRTPLTIIRGEVELALRRPRTASEYQTTLTTVSREVHRMQSLIDTLLLLVEYAHSDIAMARSLVEIDTLLSEVVSRYEERLRAKQINCDREGIEPTRRPANAELLSVVFSNLIDNAIKYSPEGSTLRLTLSPQGDRARFVIEDEGIGIPAEHIPHLTDRFFRVETSRSKSNTKTTSGFGLGLSLVQTIVELHHGTMTITSKEGKGTRVEVVV